MNFKFLPLHDNRLVVETVVALAVGVIGAALAYFARLPAPFLTGAALATTIACLMGIKLTIPNLLRDACFIMIGIQLGADMTPEALAGAAHWPFSALMLVVSVMMIVVIIAVVLKSFFNFDHNSAVLAATPGHLSYVLSLGVGVGADTSRIAVVQSLRVFFLTLFVPAFALLGQETLPSPFAAASPPMVLSALGPLCLVALGAGLFLKKLRVPAALLLGGMLVSGLAHFFRLTPGATPPFLLGPAFMVMGMVIGARFRGVTWSFLKPCLAAGLVVSTFSVLVACAASLLVWQWLDLPLLHILIAFAPGGLEAMAAMASVLDADSSYVALHHALRLFVLTVLVPVMLSARRQRDSRHVT